MWKPVLFELNISSDAETLLLQLFVLACFTISVKVAVLTKFDLDVTSQISYIGFHFRNAHFENY